MATVLEGKQKATGNKNRGPVAGVGVSGGGAEASLVRSPPSFRQRNGSLTTTWKKEGLQV